MAPVKGEHEEIASVEGTLLMLDGRTPHVGVVAQAIATGQDKTYIASTALSNSRGRYRFINLKPGKYQVRCYTPDGYICYSEEASLEVETGITLSNIDLRFPPFKKGVWRHYGPRDVDVRIIAMTNRHLLEEVAAGRFREDLYYRLSEFPIQLPPLRERVEDIPLLAEHFLADIDKQLEGFAPDLFGMLQSYPWPSNVRELRNVIRVAAALAEEGGQIQIQHFPPEITRGESLIQEVMQAIGQKTTRYRELVDRFERRCIEYALRTCNGNRTQAAKMLGIDPGYRST